MGKGATNVTLAVAVLAALVSFNGVIAGVARKRFVRAKAHEALAQFHDSLAKAEETYRESVAKAAQAYTAQLVEATHESFALGDLREAAAVEAERQLVLARLREFQRFPGVTGFFPSVDGLVGNWRVNADGQLGPPPTWTFKTDGTVLFDEPRVEGTYKVDGEILSVVVPDAQLAFRMVSISRDVIVLEHLITAERTTLARVGN